MWYVFPNAARRYQHMSLKQGEMKCWERANKTEQNLDIFALRIFLAERGWPCLSELTHMCEGRHLQMSQVCWRLGVAERCPLCYLP